MEVNGDFRPLQEAVTRCLDRFALAHVLALHCVCMCVCVCVCVCVRMCAFCVHTDTKTRASNIYYTCHTISVYHFHFAEYVTQHIHTRALAK